MTAEILKVEARIKAPARNASNDRVNKGHRDTSTARSRATRKVLLHGIGVGRRAAGAPPARGLPTNWRAGRSAADANSVEKHFLTCRGLVFCFLAFFLGPGWTSTGPDRPRKMGPRRPLELSGGFPRVVSQRRSSRVNERGRHFDV